MHTAASLSQVGVMTADTVPLRSEGGEPYGSVVRHFVSVSFVNDGPANKLPD